MNASSLHKSYCAATDVEPETPRSHFHSSLKSNLSSEEREASVFFFLMHRFAPYKETQFAIRVHLSKRDVKTKQIEEFQLGKSHTVGSERGWGLWLIVLRMHGDKEMARQRFPTCTSPLSSVWHSCVLQRTLSRLISQPFTSIVIFVLTTMGGNLFPWLSPSLPRGTPHIHVTSFNYKTPHSNSGVAKKKKKKEIAQQNCALERRYMQCDGQDMIGAFIE